MTFFEARAADVAQLEAEQAFALADGRADFAAIYAEAIETTARQLMTYSPEAGEAHFLNADGWTAATMAFAKVAELRIQEAVEQEIVDTFERGEITKPNIFVGILEELQEDGEGAFINVRGFKITAEGDRLIMTAEDGERRSFPTDNLDTE
ncbi:hypothetical protein G8E10_24890 [Rhizobiaceae bacterium CRRU44]|uniref:Uncharacterized protein n=1 Tax=Ferranicluibacter rubi TaxID=2715133 RepID=A0AA43ZJ93_9HYPH|nr:hypothetical protein [Ferranicluibacter rubi]NHT78940.1 hypothetical protein [Ferranicluibacter rubi]